MTDPSTEAHLLIVWARVPPPYCAPAFVAAFSEAEVDFFPSLYEGRRRDAERDFSFLVGHDIADIEFFTTWERVTRPDPRQAVVQAACQAPAPLPKEGAAMTD